MDTNQSYFRRTIWFIWIGFTSSILAFLFLGWVGGTSDTRSEISKAVLGVLIFLCFTVAIFSVFLARKVRGLLAADSTSQEGLSKNAMATVWYTLRLSLHEFVATVAFFIGFLNANFEFMAPFLLFALIANFLAIPRFPGSKI